MIFYKVMSLSIILNPNKVFRQIKLHKYNYVLYLIFVLSIFYIIMPRHYYKLYNSLLGKLIALVIVIYLTNLNLCVGILAAILVMVSYDKLVEGMENKDDVSKLDIEIKKSNDQHNAKKEKIQELKEKQIEKAEVIKNNNDNNSVLASEPSVNDAIAIFKLDHCLNGKVVKSNMEEIKLSDMKSYFPQITFNENDVCNPCDPKCNFKMTTFDERITVEEKLRPKETNTVSVS